RVVLVHQHLLEVELRLDLDAEFAELVSGLVEQFRSVQQRLRGNAADIEAGAAEGRPFLDHRDLHPELRRADRRNIAAGSRTNDREIESIRHDVSAPLRLRQAPCPTLMTPMGLDQPPRGRNPRRRPARWNFSSGYSSTPRNISPSPPAATVHTRLRSQGTPKT